MAEEPLWFSPTELTGFVASPWAAWMDRLCKERPGFVTRDEASPQLSMLAEQGLLHERRVLQLLENAGRRPLNLDALARLTLGERSMEPRTARMQAALDAINTHAAGSSNYLTEAANAASYLPSEVRRSKQADPEAEAAGAGAGAGESRGGEAKAGPAGAASRPGGEWVSWEDRTSLTLAALRAGVDIIYQGTLCGPVAPMAHSPLLAGDPLVADAPGLAGVLARSARAFVPIPGAAVAASSPEDVLFAAPAGEAGEGQGEAPLPGVGPDGEKPDLSPAQLLELMRRTRRKDPQASSGGGGAGSGMGIGGRSGSAGNDSGAADGAVPALLGPALEAEALAAAHALLGADADRALAGAAEAAGAGSAVKPERLVGAVRKTVGDALDASSAFLSAVAADPAVVEAALPLPERESALNAGSSSSAAASSSRQLSAAAAAAAAAALLSPEDLRAVRLLRAVSMRGIADFIVRVPSAAESAAARAQQGAGGPEDPSGDAARVPVKYEYEVWDAKLATSPQPKAVIQICAYAIVLKKARRELPPAHRVSRAALHLSLALSLLLIVSSLSTPLCPPDRGHRRQARRDRAGQRPPLRLQRPRLQ